MKAKSEHGTRLNEFVHEENHNRNRQTRAAMNIIPLEASLLSFFSFQSQAISPPNLRKSHWTFFLLVYFSSVMNFFVCPPLYFCVPFNLELSPLSFSGDISCFNNLGIVLAGGPKSTFAWWYSAHSRRHNSLFPSESGGAGAVYEESWNDLEVLMGVKKGVWREERADQAKMLGVCKEKRPC